MIITDCPCGPYNLEAPGWSLCRLAGLLPHTHRTRTTGGFHGGDTVLWGDGVETGSGALCAAARCVQDSGVPDLCGYGPAVYLLWLWASRLM